MKPIERVDRIFERWKTSPSASSSLVPHIIAAIEAAIQEDRECLAQWFLEQERDGITFNGGLAAAVARHHDSTATSDGK